MKPVIFGFYSHFSDAKQKLNIYQKQIDTLKERGAF